MKIWQDESENINITISFMEYKRIFTALEDHECEYYNKHDTLNTILAQMEKFNEQKYDTNDLWLSSSQ